MKPVYEGVILALVSQRGAALVELLREVAQQWLGERDARSWSIEFGQVSSPAGAVVFRLISADGAFPWREGAPADLARLASKLGPGRGWALALEKVARAADDEGWAEAVAYDRGDQVALEEASGQGGAATLLAWFGELLALSENEVLALFESCDQVVGVTAGEERFEDEIDQILDRARKEFQRYRDLKAAREKGEGPGASS